MDTLLSLLTPEQIMALEQAVGNLEAWFASIGANAEVFWNVITEDLIL